VDPLRGFVVGFVCDADPPPRGWAREEGNSSHAISIANAWLERRGVRALVAREEGSEGS
jgi:hypothetical protein